MTARWTDLLLVTWQVPDALLEPHLPAGVELERRDGSALASLVAFDFDETRVMGVPWPGFTKFPELNLRFYVHAGGRRGVCFVREYVPSRVVAWIARALYNEPYVGAPYRKAGAAHELEVGERVHRIAWEKSGEPYVPPADSTEHALKEHDLGFGRMRDGRTVTYAVDHPVWRVWPSVRPELDVDFGLLYGDQWSFLASREPYSVILAEGSDVRVYGAE